LPFIVSDPLQQRNQSKMKFSAGALAVIASKTGGDRSYDGRSLTTNANQLHHQHHATTHHEQGYERSEAPLASNALKNSKAHTKVTSTIIGKLQDLHEVVECDPMVEFDEDRRPESDNGIDVGILSSTCGVGRKCHEGLCVDVEGWNHQDHLRQRGLQKDVEVINSSETDIPPSDGNMTIVETMQYACDFGGLVGYDCVCNFDTNSTYSGNATCVTPLQCTTETSVCGVDVTDCYQTSYSLILEGTPGIWDAELCLKFLRPYEQTICYETSTADFAKTVLPDCVISLDGQQCSGCDVYAVGDDSNCYNFDCGNTPLAGNGRGSMIGNTCRLPAHTIGLYLDTYGCPACDLCGDDMVMSTPANAMVLFNTTYQCAYVQDVAMQGFFTTDSCNYFSTRAREPCGCADPDSITESPTPISIQNAPECNICADGVSSPDGVITMSEGRDISCSEIETAGLDGSIVGAERCEAVQNQAAGPCCGVDVVEENEAPPENACTLCGPGKTHTNAAKLVSVPTQGIFSCEELIELGRDGTLDENGICLLVQLSSQTPCGCIIDGPTMAPTSVDGEEAAADSGAAARNSLTAVLATVAAAVTASYISW
jgi:hypothetical protein